MLQTYRLFHYLSLILIAMGVFSLYAASDGLIKNELKSQTPSIYIDNWSGRTEVDQKPFTRIYVEFHPADLTFHAAKQGYIARYQLQVYILNEDEEQVAAGYFADEVRVEDYAQTAQYDKRQQANFNFTLTEGRYLARIHLIDEHIQKEAVAQKEFSVQMQPRHSFDLSDILLARKGEIATAGNQLAKTIIPFPEKSYGLFQSRLYCSFDIYQMDSQRGDSLEYTVSYIDPQNESHILESRKLASKINRIPVLYSFDTENFAPGSYRLVVQVKAGDQKQQLERANSFIVQQNLLDLRFYTFDDVVKELGLIADWNEIKRLKKLPEAQRQGALYAFWEKRDPTPLTIENEAMQEFYKRLNYARAYFGMYGDSPRGELTDQGKVYVVFGSPDSRRREKLSNRLFGYQETWFYQDRSLHLIFRSQVGESDFYLLEPFDFLKR